MPDDWNAFHHVFPTKEFVHPLLDPAERTIFLLLVGANQIYDGAKLIVDLRSLFSVLRIRFRRVKVNNIAYIFQLGQRIRIAGMQCNQYIKLANMVKMHNGRQLLLGHIRR